MKEHEIGIEQCHIQKNIKKNKKPSPVNTVLVQSKFRLLYASLSLGKTFKNLDHTSEELPQKTKYNIF